MSRQSDKYHVAMAGEFFVAAQLQRLGFAAAVTYGNAKRADVVVLSPDSERAVLVEVKTTSRAKWPVGNRAPEPSRQPWVFVWLPEAADESPEYYVLTQAQLYDILISGQDRYFAAYEAKHGESYGDRPGVVSLSRADAAPYRNNWQVIRELAAPPANAPPN